MIGQDQDLDHLRIIYQEITNNIIIKEIKKIINKNKLLKM